MKNPLAGIVEYEERSDGVYIKVNRDANKPILYRSIVNALEDAMVLEYDGAVIEGVIARGRGAFEKIASPFEYYKSGLDAFVKVDRTALKAMITINSGVIAAGLKPTVASLKYCLKRKNVIHGLDMEALKNIIANNIYDAEVIVAEGTPPRDGFDGKIEYEIKIDPDKKPEILANGNVDFRSIKTFTQVSHKQIIAHKIPPTAGKPGIAVTGEPIAAIMGKDCILQPGENVYVSDDGKSLIAGCSGIIFLTGGMLHIKENLEIARNVDFAVGNIKFSGNVTIRGNVNAGFTVESDEDVTINGEVESATVKSRNGTVTIKKGVIGKDDTFIYGKKGVHLNFAQSAKIITEGELIIDKSILHCECKCDILRTDGYSAQIIGGEYKVFTAVEVANLGNKEGISPKIFLIDKQKAILREKRNELLDLKEKLTQQLAPVKKQLNTKANLFKKAGDNVTDRHKTELKKWLDQYNSLKMKFEYVEKKIQEVTDLLKKPENYCGFVKAKGTIFPGTEINLYGNSKIIQSEISNKRFVLEPTGVQAGENEDESSDE